MDDVNLAADLAAMNQISDLQASIATEADLKAGLDQILKVACQLGGCERGYIQLLSDDCAGLELYTWLGYAADSPFLQGMRYEKLKSDSGLLHSRPERVIVEDWTKAAPSVEAAANVEDIRASQSTPMISRKGTPIGMLSTQWSEPRVPADDVLHLIDLLASTAADFVELHRVTEAHRKYEERLEAVVNIPGVGILVFDPATGGLIDANDAFLEMSGYTREMIERGELTWRTMTPDEWVAISEVEMKVLEKTGRIGPYEKEYFRADGTRCWMLFSGARVDDGTVVEYCVDMSKLKPHEKPG